ncbi:hypothetical protein CJ739_1682 [Mariniflexile rhizosphaerae]|nr:hypothetical protein CJ739_1682 [Mariniflexile sp. TRM1-10]
MSPKLQKILTVIGDYFITVKKQFLKNLYKILIKLNKKENGITYFAYSKLVYFLIIVYLFHFHLVTLYGTTCFKMYLGIAG